ncbi:helix-turn-helix transcriptional regulator [Streptomyces sp. DSM 41524]|uniref:Helix-turn-helix domain-containing protein n=3 Tax=Streptomyces TaxID=1883 RepID=A0A6G4AQ89_9ACTN|nr:helix-turn-helix transcriptional regulator [Streptomyces rhizosphaericus]MEE4598472.1 helix-turn-helix transcriptional regulator [Streptomyces sp. DSM 41524]NEW74954.1 helix-turn-helix domain-containing protein [Streptomyces rhizosphaericus]
MQGNSTSTVLGRRLGGELTKLRTAAGLTQTHAAKVLTGSTTKVAKMEGGWVPMRDPDIRALCELYGLSDPAAVGGLLELARVDRERRKAKGWWNEFPNLGDMQEYVALENAATSIRTWQLCLVPGLLQTPGYARALAMGNSTKGHPDRGETLVATRIARQRRLSEEPTLDLWAVVHESALRHRVGGTAVMREQLKRLEEAAQQPNITIQILPFEAGEHLGMGGAFNIISFAEPGAMDVVYTETAFGQLWVEGGDEAAQHQELFEKIARHALAESESRSFIEALRGDVSNGGI